MTNVLDNLEPSVAAGLLARAALALESSSQNPATVPRVHDELSIRSRVVADARAHLGISPDDVSDDAIAAICERLDEAADQLISQPDLEGAALRLAMRGELPSDRFKVEVISNLAEVYDPHFENEVRRIKGTVNSPDIEQHFGPAKRIGEPALISLFLRYYSSHYPRRSFYHLVIGQRAGLTLTIHQAWRLYPSVIQVAPSKDLVALLRSFADAYGAEVDVEGVRGKMLVDASLPAGSKSIVKLEPKTSSKVERSITSWFTQNESNGEIRGSLIVSINFTEYKRLLNHMRWGEELLPDEKGPFPELEFEEAFLSEQHGDVAEQTAEHAVLPTQDSGYSSRTEKASPPQYLVRITRRGPSTAPFGWQIIRQEDLTELARSAETFPTRTEALSNSARKAVEIMSIGFVSGEGDKPEVNG